MSGKKVMKRYPLAMKLEAIRMYQEDGKSRKEIALWRRIIHNYCRLFQQGRFS